MIGLKNISTNIRLRINTTCNLFLNYSQKLDELNNLTKYFPLFRNLLEHLINLLIDWLKLK